MERLLFGGWFLRRRFFGRLARAFPQDFREDVRAVCSILPLKSEHYHGWMYSEESTTWTLQDGERVSLPCRLHIKEASARQIARLDARQQLIYHCLMSRSYDGYVREAHLRILLESDREEWVKPFVLAICEEYVVELLQTVYESLSRRDHADYLAFCRQNFESVRLGHSRMISNWSAYYRFDCYRYRDYIGRRLYRECFGYRRTGQKFI